MLLIIGILFVLLLQQSVVKTQSKNITLNALGKSFVDNTDFFNSLLDKFNRYSKEQNLNIEINLIKLSNTNASLSVADDIALINQLYVKKTIKYDLIFYYNLDLQNFDKYFLDLRNYINKDLINMYDLQILSQTCFKNNKLVGLPLTNNYSVLYYNRELLKKYNKDVPKTWDELIKVGKEIVEAEKKLNNNSNLIAYNGLFNSLHTTSFYEFIYSYRYNKTSPFPAMNSEETYEAFEKMKELNKELNIDGEFTMGDDFTVSKLRDGSAVFINYWILSDPLASIIKENYDMTTLPGRNEELSAASISGYNIGINSLLATTHSEDENITNKEKLEACIKVTEFLNSKDTQKTFMIEGDSITAMSSLFEDKDVCEVNDCKLLKRMQPVVNKIYEANGGMYERNEYETKFRNLAFKYIFEDNVDLQDTLKKIDDIIKIYTVSLGNIFGLITFSLIIILAILMLTSLIFLFLENFKPFFKFLSIDSWSIIIIGSVLILSAALMNLGEITVTKCNLKISLLDIGIKMYLSVITYELISNLPSEIKPSVWIKNRKYLFLSILLSFEILLNLLLIVNPFTVKNVIKEEGQNYKECKMRSSFGKSVAIIIIIEKVLLVLTILFLLFVEWNKRKIYYELRFILFSINSNLFLVFISFLVNIIKINNYYIHFVIQEYIIIFISVLVYSSLYGYKLFFALCNGKNVAFINNKNKNFIDGTDMKVEKSYEEGYGVNYSFKTTNNGENNGETNSNGKNYGNRRNNNNGKKNNEKEQKHTIFSKIISYHYSSFLSSTEVNADTGDNK